jgi:hypothetical protein
VAVPFPHTLWGTGNGLPPSLPAPRWGSARTIGHLGPVRGFHHGDETIEAWSALDALVLKATALVLAAHWLPGLSPHCHHLLGRGGAKAAVRFVHEQLAANTLVFRADVESYYASSNHDVLLGLLEQAVPDGRVLDLLRRYVRRTIYVSVLLTPS